jgi:hypothetical protein
MKADIDTHKDDKKYDRSRPVKVIDAVMGTGKSTFITMYIRENPSERYIVVLPKLTELKRYESQLQALHGLVSLYEGAYKKNRFDDALEHASVILITHTLYEEFLNDTSFEVIEKGNWNLIMDEVVTAFETIQLDHTAVRGLVDINAVKVKAVNENIDEIVRLETIYMSWSQMPEHTVNKKKRSFLSDMLAKRVLATGGDIEMKNRYYAYALKEERLAPFSSITILTYLFLDTDLDYWFQIHKIPVNHLGLTQHSKTDSISDFSLVPHTGVYSGASFKHLVEFVEPKSRSKKTAIYGSKQYHFSSTSMKTIFDTKTKEKNNLKIQKEVRNALINVFRNKRKGMCEPEDFMFTCRKNSIPVFQDSKNCLPESFVGEHTYVPFNERATNHRSHKHYLAYVYNAYPFPPVVKVIQAHNIKYNINRHSLYMLIQWIWRSAVRREEKIYIYLPSIRMKKILIAWLNA